jgi:polysaccharide transporter, PST family
LNGLAAKARLAIFWTASFNLYRELFDFAVTLVLVRLLTPQAYGEFGLVMSVLAFVNVFSLQSFVAHTLQLREDRDVDYQLHFTAGGAVQVALFAVTHLLAIAIRGWPPYRPIAPLLHVSAFVFLLQWPADLRAKMLERALDWRRLRLLLALGVLLGGVLSVSLALGGAGVYALVLAPFPKHLVFAADLFLVNRWRPTWKWHAASYAPAWRFGLARLASAGLGVGKRLLESAIFVRIAGFAEFGLYGRALGLGQTVCLMPATQLTYSIYPVLTKVPMRSDQFRTMSALLLRAVAWAAIPFAIALSTLAEPAVRVAFGARWVACAPLVPWTMGAIGAAALLHVASTLLLAGARQQWCVALDAWTVVGTVFCLLVFLPGGAAAYLRGLFAVHAAGAIAGLAALRADRAIDLGGIRSGLVPPALASLFAFTLCEAARHLASIDTNGVALAFAYGAGFLAAYLAFLRICFGPPLHEMLRHFPMGPQLTTLLRFST